MVVMFLHQVKIVDGRGALESDIGGWYFIFPFFV